MADSPTVTIRVLDSLENLTDGSAQVATDEIGGVHYQRVKVAFGLDGTAFDVSQDTPLPVELLGTVTTSPPQTLSAAEPGKRVEVDNVTSVVVLSGNLSRVQATLIPEGDVYMSISGEATAASGKLLGYTPYNIPSGYVGQVQMLSVSGTIFVNVWDI